VQHTATCSRRSVLPLLNLQIRHPYHSVSAFRGRTQTSWVALANQTAHQQVMFLSLATTSLAAPTCHNQVSSSNKRNQVFFSILFLSPPQPSLLLLTSHKSCFAHYLNTLTNRREVFPVQLMWLLLTGLVLSGALFSLLERNFFSTTPNPLHAQPDKSSARPRNGDLRHPRLETLKTPHTTHYTYHTTQSPRHGCFLFGMSVRKILKRYP